MFEMPSAFNGKGTFELGWVGYRACAFGPGRVWATGRVLRYNQKRWFGFIQRQGTSEEYFVHENSTQSTDPLLCSGLNVRFDIDICDKGYEATNVKVV